MRGSAKGESRHSHLLRCFVRRRAYALWRGSIGVLLTRIAGTADAAGRCEVATALVGEKTKVEA